MLKLLILSSNPKGDLELGREIDDLNTAVERFGNIETKFRVAVRPQDLQELLAQQPQFVHFCGHGAGARGLVFQNEHGQEQFVSANVLAQLFGVYSDQINCVVLNACDSDQQAEAIVEHINYTIGMSQPILDKAAYSFAIGFYQGLAAGRSIEQAYILGCLSIQIWSETNSLASPSRQYRKLEYVGQIRNPAQIELPEHLKPVLRKKSERPSHTDHSVQAALPSDAPPRFVEVVQEEAGRKEYKDQARSAYDNFGQFSAQNAANISKSEYEQRKILLGQVKSFWIEGFLKPSLQYRNDCVRALNQFIELFPQTEIAVCSRVHDYEALTERLEISSALCLQPLTSQQVYQFLSSVGGSLAGLNALLKQDPNLEQFAQTPLILNLMSSAYQGWSVERLRQELRSIPDRKQHLFDTYVDHRIERGAASDYPKPQVLHWLSWLANLMVQEKQTVFLIEKMQPTWLQNRSEKRAYHIGTFVMGGLIGGLMLGLMGGLTNGLMGGLSVGSLFGLGLGKKLNL